MNPGRNDGCTWGSQRRYKLCCGRLAEAILEVPYEGLVTDLPAWTRRMLEFIGVPWDARCLEFNLTARPVVTASKWQVRQKLFGSSVGRWRHYQRFLTPLIPLLELQS